MSLFFSECVRSRGKGASCGVHQRLTTMPPPDPDSGQSPRSSRAKKRLTQTGSVLCSVQSPSDLNGSPVLLRSPPVFFLLVGKSKLRCSKAQTDPDPSKKSGTGFTILIQKIIESGRITRKSPLVPCRTSKSFPWHLLGDVIRLVFRPGTHTTSVSIVFSPCLPPSSR